MSNVDLSQNRPDSNDGICDRCGSDIIGARHVSIEWNGWHTAGMELCAACSAEFLEHLLTFVAVSDMDTLRALMHQMDDLSGISPLLGYAPRPDA